MEDKTLKARIHDYLEHNRSFNATLLTFIILNTIAISLESIQSINDQYSYYFDAFEVFSVGLFTVEYVLRVWSYRGSKVRYLLSPLAIVDLLAVLPFYIPLLIPMDLRFVRLFRVFRFIRVLKIARYSASLQLFARVLAKRKEELLVSILAIFIVLIISSVLMYFIEREYEPDKFGTIPHALWWGIVTLTTVGYGDVVPTSVAGKILASFVAILSIGLFTLPSGIIAAGFIEEVNCKDKQLCPHCGKKIEP
jgi:voltage-gated potassium channel